MPVEKHKSHCTSKFVTFFETVFAQVFSINDTISLPGTKLFFNFEKAMALNLENFEFKQKDLDVYAKGLKLTKETETQKFEEHVPVGLLVTIGVTNLTG